MPTPVLGLPDHGTTEQVAPKLLSLSIKIAQKPYIIRSLGPKASKNELVEGKGIEMIELNAKPETPKPLNPKPLNP